MSEPYDLLECSHFTAGAVGEPGQRVFYLQAAGSGPVVTIRCEKVQVAAIGESFGRMLEQLEDTTPAGGNAPLLRGPLEADFVAGSLALGFDQSTDKLVLVIEELVEEGEPSRTARWFVSRPQARAFAERAALLMSGGRPICWLCGLPMNTDGHTCPKTNGHHPH